MAEGFIQKRVNTPEEKPEAAPVNPETASVFKENTPQERLIAKTDEREGDEFTIEATVKLNSIDTGASVRTIVSRWNTGKENVESFGWSLGVTGEKSRFKPRNLIMQLVGEDENSNIAYEVVASDLRLELGVSYHIVAKVSCAARNVTFRVQQLDKPGAPLLTSVASHHVRRGLDAGSSDLVIGGLTKRAPSHHWDGRIDAARVVSGIQPDDKLSPDPAKWTQGMVLWNAAKAPGDKLAWASAETSQAADPRLQAMADLCHVLLNANEFFYLH